MKILLCIAILSCAALPLAFRRQLWVRIGCVFLLLGIAFLHLGYLIAQRRLLDENVRHHYAELESMDGLPSDIEFVFGEVQRMSHGQVWTFVCLIIALSVLAIVPAGGTFIANGNRKLHSDGSSGSVEMG